MCHFIPLKHWRERIVCSNTYNVQHVAFLRWVFLRERKCDAPRARGSAHTCFVVLCLSQQWIMQKTWVNWLGLDEFWWQFHRCRINWKPIPFPHHAHPMSRYFRQLGCFWKSPNRLQHLQSFAAQQGQSQSTSSAGTAHGQASWGTELF